MKVNQTRSLASKYLRCFFPVLGLATFALNPSPARAIEVAFEEDASLPLVYINVGVKAGAAADPTGQGGITSFMAKMLARGTQSRSKEQLNLALDQIGAHIETETRTEMLVIRGAVLASKVQDFLPILLEVVSEPSFPIQEIEKLKSETISEILEETAQDGHLAGQKFTKFLFGAHPYGNPVLGTQKEVAAITREKLIHHYDKVFQDRFFLVLGSGSTSSSKIISWAEALSKKRPNSSQSPLIQLTEPKNPSTQQVLFVDKPDRTQVQIHIGHVGHKLTAPEHFALHLANSAFGGESFNTRLMQEIRVKRGWSYGAYSLFRFGTQPRSWQMQMGVANKDAASAIEYVLTMLNTFREQGITEAEFQFAKNNLINSAGFMYNTPKKRVENKLLEMSLGLPDGFMKSYAAEIAKLTLPQVNQAIRTFFKPENVKILVLGTASQSKDAIVKAVRAEEKNVHVVDYRVE